MRGVAVCFFLPFSLFTTFLLRGGYTLPTTVFFIFNMASIGLSDVLAHPELKESLQGGENAKMIAIALLALTGERFQDIQCKTATQHAHSVYEYILTVNDEARWPTFNLNLSVS